MKKKLPLIAIIIFLGVCVAAYVAIPKSYGIYQEALALAKTDAVLIDRLGQDISDSLFPYSHISKGMARIEVTISGNKSSGLLLIRGEKKGDEWALTSVLFEHTPDSKRYAVFKDRKN